MFTGIVECMAKVILVQQRGGILLLGLEVPLDLSDTRVGDSFSINGACLTAVRLAERSVNFEVSKETCERTTLGSLRVGALVNVERSLRVTDRIGGHLVTGHIDETGEVVDVVKIPKGTRLTVRVGPKVKHYLAEKGSICIDGVSLTVGECGKDWFVVHLIPHTLKSTTLQYLKPGDRVNLEADLIAKYVERILFSKWSIDGTDGGISIELLGKYGFL